ncbi:hypothetical protein MXB_326 [Myxobolus squamalis]|nr:hypothetical protein MXB_326 [Myxobolus squamalis]
MDAENISVYKRIQIPKSIRPHKSNPVITWWKNLSSPTIIKEANSVNCIDFSPVKPYDFIYASGSKSYLYSGHSNELVRTYTSKDVIHSCSYRSDGRLFCVGSRDGYVQLDLRRKQRQIKCVTSVFVSLFSQNNSQLFTASSDCILKLWDISSASLIFSKECHSDRIKCGCTLPNNPNLFITGSYDHKVGMWDTRISESQKWIIDHGAPVESVLVHPNGLLLMSSGGNSIRIWDLANGGRLLHQMSPHFKTITRLNFSHCCSYFHSSSIDWFIFLYNLSNVKSYSMQTYEVLNSTKYDYPILDFSISPDNNRVGAALINNDESYGLVFLKCVKRNDLMSETSSIDTISSEQGENFKQCPYSHRMYVKSLTKLRQILAKEMEYIQSSLEVIGSIDLIQMISNVSHNSIEHQNSTTLSSNNIPE